MPCMSSPLVIVLLPSGNRALYRVQPQHVPREGVPASFDWPRSFGRHMGTQFDGKWHARDAHGAMVPLDGYTESLIERCPEFRE